MSAETRPGAYEIPSSALALHFGRKATPQTPTTRPVARHQYGGLIEGGTVACARCHKLLTAGEWFTPCEGRSA